MYVRMLYSCLLKVLGTHFYESLYTFCDIFYCNVQMDYTSTINSLFIKEGTLWEFSVRLSSYQCILMNICCSIKLLGSAKVDVDNIFIFLFKKDLYLQEMVEGIDNHILYYSG